MAGLGIRLYLDEMFSARVAAALRRRAYDVESCYDAGLGGRRVTDVDQLAYAAQQGRAILTCNARDFVPLDRAYKTSNREQASCSAPGSTILATSSVASNVTSMR